MRRYYLTRTVLVLLALCLGACSTFRPLPVNEPATLAEADKTFHGLGHPQDLAGAKEIVYGYANAYMSAAEKLHGASYNAADVTVGGGLLGMIGGLTSSPETAIVGAVASGLSGMTSQRYAFQIQAKNYEGAAETMECMADVLAYAKQDEIDFIDLNHRINDVRRKLRQNQAKIDIATTDTSALEAALKKLTEAKEAERKAEKNLLEAMGQTGGQGDNKNVVSMLTALSIALNEKATEANRAAFLKCVAAY